jgi:hypothetical protein
LDSALPYLVSAAAVVVAVVVAEAAQPASPPAEAGSHGQNIVISQRWWAGMVRRLSSLSQWCVW